MRTDQRVSGQLQYIPESDLSSRHAWRCPTPLTSWVSVHTLHAWCPLIKYCCSCNLSSFQDHLTYLECTMTAMFLMTQKHLSIVFLASLLVSTRLFPILDFVLKFCFCMDTQQKSTSCQLSINKNLWFVVLRINPQSSLHNCLDVWGSVLLIFFCFFVFFVCFYFCI